MNKVNDTNEKISFTNGMNNQKYTNGCSWSLEDVTKTTKNDYKCNHSEIANKKYPSQHQDNNITHLLNNNNANCKATTFSISDVFDYNDDDLYEDEMRISRKVRRCFGKTVCMPQTLLCFKVWLVFSFVVLLIAHNHI